MGRLWRRRLFGYEGALASGAVCCNVDLQRWGGGGLKQRKALASAVVVDCPREKSSLSLHSQLYVLLSFLEE